MNRRIEAIHFTANQKLLVFIEGKLDKLNQYFNRIIDCHVMLKLENSGQIRDKVVEVKIAVPGDMLIAKCTSKSFESATDEAADILKRQLIRYKERARSYS
ncbi:MAG: ribosome-associated translation inhibitor RaiA [Saprospiraceae bacterium]|nr:ribosome-associated translation inhibitor RaiA [Saprospiraceae bacterium]